MQAVTKNHVNALMLQMREKGQSARSQQQARAVLSAAFESALEDDLVASNPVSKSRTISLDSAQIHPLSLAEVQTLLVKTMVVQMQARVRMAVLYAMRQGEALGLQWKDVDFNKKTVFIWQQIQKIEGTYQFVKLKSEDSIRTLEIDDETLTALKAHKVQQNLDRLAMGEEWQDHDLVEETRRQEQELEEIMIEAHIEQQTAIMEEIIDEELRREISHDPYVPLIGDPYTGSLLPQKYTLRLDGTIIDRREGLELKDKLGERAIEIGQSLLKHHPTGGRLRLSADGTVV